MSLIDKAKKILIENMEGYRISNPKEKAYEHSFRVYNILEEDNFNEDVLIAGILHDIIEDTKLTSNSLNKYGFSQYTINLINYCTHNTSLGNEKDKRESLKEKLISCDDANVRAIKIADCSDNFSQPLLHKGTSHRQNIVLKKGSFYLYHGSKYLYNTNLYNDFLEKFYNTADKSLNS